MIALATDLPRVTEALLRRLATEHPGAPALAPHDGERYQPLFARYSPATRAPLRAALERRELSLQPLLARVGAVTFPLTPDESAALDDWDEPADLARGA
ncbi:MAG: hypothetical protein FJ104_02220 [Deltaproteobacteria bacterium]|nr:hypothetical protein [Deltaproteobacteria bacterium]